MTLSNAQIEQRRQAGRKGGRKGGRTRAKAFTSEYQQAARSKVRPESNRANGRKGYEATFRNHGAHYFPEKLAKWRRRHLTRLARTVRAWLDEWGETYAIDAPIGRYYVDFLLPHNVIIECKGRHWHTNNDHHGEDREAYDREREEALRAAGYTLICLDEAEIDDESSKEPLRARLQQISTIPF